MAGKLSQLFGAQDMTVGKPVNSLIRFSIPLLVGNLAQQLYSTVDAVVVGRYVGDEALAAVGASQPLFNLILVLFVGISSGASVMVSQYFGARQKDNVSLSVGNTCTVIFFGSLFFMACGPLITRPLYHLLGTPEDIFEMSVSYINILFYGILGMAFYNIISAILRGLGDSVLPLLYLLIACGLNIVLDIWFVAGLQWGVAGAGIATIISQFVSAVFCVVRLLRMRDVMHINWDTLKLRRRFVAQLLRLGLPAGLTQMVFSLAGIVVQSLTNSFGSAIIAVNTVVMRVDGFAMMPNFTFGVAMATFSGQNIGAGRLDRVDKGTKDGMKLGLITSVILVTAIILLGGMLASLFTTTPEVIRRTVVALRILGLGYIAMAVTQTLSGVMRGAGDTMVPMWISIITTVAVRVPIAYGLEYLTRPEGGALGTGDPLCLFYSLSFSWILGGVLTAVAFRRGGWRKKSLVQQREPGEPAPQG